MVVREKHSSLMDPFVSYKKGSDVNTHPGFEFKTLHFLSNLQICHISYSVKIQKAGNGHQGETL
jgi:hypothetical protein